MMMNHPGMFAPAKGTSQWSPRLERPFTLPVGTKQKEEDIARAILRENGLAGPFFVQRSNRKTFMVTHFRFLKRTRFTYFVEEQRLIVEDKKFLISDVLTGMHTSGGFQEDKLFYDLWAVVVDLVAAAILFWIASGLYMWLQQSPRLRKWGFVVIAAGAFTFGYFLFVL